MKEMSLLNFTLCLVLALCFGWLLYAGKSIVLPLVTAVIVVYVMVSASDWLHRYRWLQSIPLSLIRFALALFFD